MTTRLPLLLLCATLAACATTTAARLDSNLPAAAPDTSPAAPPPTSPSPDSPRAGRDATAAKALTEHLATLPRCAPGDTVGQLTLAPSMCTRMACREACCNQCTWTATFVSTNGVPAAVAPEQVSAVLRLAGRALECEVAAWNGVLAGRDLGLDGGGCLVR